MSPQHAAHKPFRPSWVRAMVAVFTVLVVSAASIAGFNIWLLDNTLKQNSVNLHDYKQSVPGATMTAAPDPFQTINDPFTLLIVGSDSGDGSVKYGSRNHNLNDVNLLLHIYPGWTAATTISFPRDLIVDFPDCVNQETGAVVEGSTGKLNTALSKGGLGCVVETISSITGHQVDNALMIGFEGVVSLSNAVGGVDVCLTEPINDYHTGLVLEAGNHTLQGDQALGFLRTRYGVGDGSDLSRISNQQSYLSSLLRKIKSEQTLTDPVKLVNLANAVSQNTILSSNLADVAVLGNIGFSLRNLNLDQVTFTQAPTSYVQNGVALIPEASEELFDAVFSNQPVQITGNTGPGNIGTIKQDVPTYEEPLPEGVNVSDDALPVSGSARAGVLERLQNQTDSTTTDNVTTGNIVQLQPAVTGQTAAEYTCSRGYSG